MLHARDTDWRVIPADAVDLMIRQSGAQDGDEIEITVRVTGQRPFGDRKMMWVSSGTFAREGHNPEDDCVVPEHAADEPTEQVFQKAQSEKVSGNG